MVLKRHRDITEGYLIHSYPVLLETELRCLLNFIGGKITFQQYNQENIKKTLGWTSL